MSTPSIAKKEILAWCLYDFANSSFTTVIVTVAYSVYFTQVVAQGHSPEAWWGRGYALSMILIGVISPVLGALADYSGTKKRTLIGFTFLSVFATLLLVLVREGDIWLGLILFGLANIGYNGGLTFYDAFLKEISHNENMGRISGYGWSLGYIGGLFSLLLVYPFIQGGLGAENLFRYRLSFPVTAVFFLIFSIPAFLYLKERAATPTAISLKSYWAIGFRRVGGTFREMRRFIELFKYFLAFLIYNDGINTVIVFSAIFAAGVLGFTPRDLIIYFIVMQVTAALGAYGFGFVTDWIGAKRTIAITLVVWIGLIVWAFLVSTKAEFYALGLIAGAALGSNQSASRTLLGLFAPRAKIAEFFGFFSLTGKLAATIGPLVYGEIATATGSQRWAVLSIGVFFVIGLILLQWVDEQKGIDAALQNQ